MVLSTPLRRLTTFASLYVTFQNYTVHAAEEDNDDEDETDTSTDTATTTAAEKDDGRPAHWQDTPTLTDMWKLVGRDGNGLSDDQDVEKKAEAALEAYVYNNAAGVQGRSRDGRGFLFWAWEFQSKHALAVAKAYGVDPFIGDESHTKSAGLSSEDVEAMKDLGGAFPFHMCKGKKVGVDSEDVDDDVLEDELANKDMTGVEMIADMPEQCIKLVGKDLTGLDETVKEILVRKQKREEAETASLDDEDDEDDDDDIALNTKVPGADVKSTADETDDDDDDASAEESEKKKLDVNVGLDDDDL